MSPRQFLPLLGWNCTWQPEPLHPSDKWKQKPGEIPYLHLGTRMHEERARIRRDGVRKTEKTRRKWMYSTFGWWFGTFLFFHIFGIIIPTDFHIFQRGRYTTNQTCSGSMFHPIHTLTAGLHWMPCCSSRGAADMRVGSDSNGVHRVPMSCDMLLLYSGHFIIDDIWCYILLYYVIV